MSDYKAAAKQSATTKAGRITGGKYRPGHSAKGYADGGDVKTSSAKSSYGSMFIPTPSKASGGAVGKKKKKGSGETQINIIIAGGGPGAGGPPPAGAAPVALPTNPIGNRSAALPPMPTNSAQPPLGGTANLVRKRGGRA